jgi:hypothetical protein
MQLYKAYPKCDGTCANNYDGNTYCYAPAKYYNLGFKIQIGINLYFFTIYKTIFNLEKNDLPICLN